MTRCFQRLLLAGIFAGLLGALEASPWWAMAQETPALGAASAPGAAMGSTRPGISPTNTMNMRFVNASVDTILTEMSQRFGYLIIKPVDISSRVTIEVPNPVHADEAVRLVNAALYTLGYQALESRTGEGAAAKTVLRVVTVLEAKKANIPVRTGADPKEIPSDDSLITQIIPLPHLDSARLRSELAMLMSSDADITSNAGANCIIITDTSKNVRRIVEIIAALEKLAAERMKTESARVRDPYFGVPAGVTVVTGAYVITGPGVDATASGRRIAGEAEVIAPRAAIVVPVNGILEKVLVRDGDAVKAGEVIAAMDGRGKEAELKAALARVALAKAELTRSEAVEKALEAAVKRAAVTVAEAEVQRHRVAMTQLEIKAPFDGMLTRVTFRAGDFVSAGEPLTEVVDQGELRLAFSPPSIPEPEKYIVGAKFKLRMAGALENYQCEVSYVPPEGAGSGERNMRAKFTGAAEGLKAGMRGSVGDVEP